MVLLSRKIETTKERKASHHVTNILVKTTVQARDPLLGGWSSKRPGVSSQGWGGYVRDQGSQANGGGGCVRDQGSQGKGAGGSQANGGGGYTRY